MSSLGNKARSAIIWNVAFNLFRDILQFCTMIALVRLLKPESYGEFALVNSVLGLLSILSHSNFVAYTIQVKDEADTRYQDHFSASAVLQIALFVITNVVAYILNFVPKYSTIAPFVHVMSLNHLVDWPSELRKRMLERSFDWKKLRYLQAIGLVSGAVLALIMGFSGTGTYALLVPGLITSLPFIFDLFVTEGWRPTWAWSWAHYKPAWDFGVMRFGGGLSVRCRQLLESSVLSDVIGFAMLGIYGRALGLAQMFCQKFSEQILAAIYPILSRIDGNAHDSAYIGGLILRTIAWVSIPIAIVFSALAEPVVNTVYGSQWTQVSALLPWAMAWGALSAISHATYMLLLAKQQTRKCTHLDFCMLIATGATLMGILPYGLTAYISILAVSQLAASFTMMSWLVPLNALSWRGVWDAFSPPVFAGLPAWLLSNIFANYIFGSRLSPVVFAVFWGFSFCIIYIVIIRLLFIRQMMELIIHLPGRKILSKFLFIKFPIQKILPPHKTSF